MNLKTSMQDGGWEAKSRIPLIEPLQLDIDTHKSVNGGVTTIASVVKVEDGVTSFARYGDFRETVERDKTARCTEKTVRVQHEAALANLPEILERVYAFYEAKGVKTIRPAPDTPAPGY